ncbi:MAG: energy transducer TonB [Veillonella sp.]|nr:energy transducer TonB [Veillonella sp.]
MVQPEPPEQEKKEQEKIVSDDKENAAGGKSGSVLPDLSGKLTPGLQNLNPYLGGDETASVNLHGNTDNPVGVPGDGDTTGPGGGPVGNGGIANDGPGTQPGTQGGNPGTSDTEGSGSYSSAGYIARVESNKVMPQQAVRRGITGTVSFDVTFDSDGNFVSALKTGSSGSSILDDAAYSLVSSSGGIENTTGHSVTIEVNVSYNLN